MTKFLTDWWHVQRDAWATLRELRGPRQAIYYWIYRPSGGWRLAFWLAPDNHCNAARNLSHRLVWAEVMEHLASLWQIDVDFVRSQLINRFASLPRGRVVLNPRRVWTICRGEHPVVPNEIERLCRVFKLDKATIREFRDDHWDRLPKDQEAIDQLFHLSISPPSTGDQDV